MNKKYFWRWLILIGLVSWSLAIVLPLHEKINQGIDLKGGMSFLLEVDTSELDEDAKEDAAERALEVIRNRIDELGIKEASVYAEPSSQRIIVQIPGEGDESRQEALDTIKRSAFLELRVVHENNAELVDTLMASELVPPGYRLVWRDEPGASGQMEKTGYYVRDTSLDPEGATEKTLRDRLLRFQVPPGGYHMMLQRVNREGRELYRPYFVKHRYDLTGERLVTARVNYQELGQPIVSIRFDGVGKETFGRLTRALAPGGEMNPGLDSLRQLAIIMDGTIYSAPVVRSAIYGDAQIEGMASLQEAKTLAIVLRAGALPAPVKVLEERIVGPALGQDSIDSGKRAAVYGGVTVLVFMLAYYLLAGVVANLALCVTAVLVPLGMMVAAGFLSLLTGGGGGGSAIGLPTLTLPGIAGLILTIGMAVDANVLIFERIREEQKSGKRFASAINAGYEKVFSTIFDANLTTLITAVILFWQGSGPIRGFAITLSAGILVSMYTALIITRLLFDGLAARTSLQAIKMFEIVKSANINFLGKRALAGVLSAILISVSWVMFLNKGMGNFGVDFTGGMSVVLDFEEKVPVQDVRNALQDAGIQSPFIQYNQVLNPDNTKAFKEYLEVKAPFEQGDLAKEALVTFRAQGFEIIQEDRVGPQVGRELRKRGIAAIVWALIGVVIYVSLRFEFAFAMGAIAALLHDVLITIGLFCLFGNQLSLPIIAALLTIVGYSVNDTIVVFDRIRENIGLMRGKNYLEVANMSINQTLGRTLLTSITTLLSVVMLLLFGGGAIHHFAFALFIGILVGTYSSIFIATPVMLLWHRVPEEKEAK